MRQMRRFWILEPATQPHALPLVPHPHPPRVTTTATLPSSRPAQSARRQLSTHCWRTRRRRSGAGVQLGGGGRRGHQAAAQRSYLCLGSAICCTRLADAKLWLRLTRRSHSWTEALPIRQLALPPATRQALAASFSCALSLGLQCTAFHPAATPPRAALATTAGHCAG